MQTKSKRLLTAAAVLMIALVIYLFATAPLPPDQKQISDAIENARAAVQRRSSTGVMSVVSDTYKDDNFANVEQLHFVLGHAFHSSGPIAVTVDGTSILVHGDSAQSTSDLTIKSLDGTTWCDCNVNLTWKRESTHRLLFFPSTAWRVVSASYPGMPSVGDL